MDKTNLLRQAITQKIAPLLANRLYVDTETAGLGRGSGIHELATYHPESRTLKEYHFNSYVISTTADKNQEYTQLAESELDQFHFKPTHSWLMSAKQQLVARGLVSPQATDIDVVEYLKIDNPLLARAIENHPEMLGGSDAARIELLTSNLKLNQFAQQTGVDIRTFLQPGGEFSSILKGKTVWGQNIAFDSKHIGAVLGAMKQNGVENGIKTLFESHSVTSQSPFYVTGKAVNAARIEATLSDDWTGVWKAYNANIVKGDLSAAREMGDVTKAMMSYGQKLGMLEPGKLYYGTGLDLQFRLFGSLEQDPAKAKAMLLSPESHRAAEDIAVHSEYVLNKAAFYAQTLQEVHENTALGKELVGAAQKGEGPLHEANLYFQRLMQVKPVLQTQNVTKRLERSMVDILKTGSSWQFNGYGWGKGQKVNVGGTEETFDTLRPLRTAFNSNTSLVNYLAGTGDYGNADISDISTKMEGAVVGNTLMEKQRALAEHVQQITKDQVSGFIESHADELLSRDKLLPLSLRARGIAADGLNSVIDAIKIPSMKSYAKAAGMFAGAAALSGMVYTAWSGSKDTVAKSSGDNQSLLVDNYDEWYAQQQQFFGTAGVNELKSGMSERGIGAQIRKRLTDFGSPYLGPKGSKTVLYQQALIQAREKWLTEKYINGSMSGPNINMFQTISSSRHLGHSLYNGGSIVQGGRIGLANRSLSKIDLTNGWDIQVDDADTVAIKRNDWMSRAAGLFGMNPSYIFRLAGIDAPETKHPGQLAGAQPQAYESTAALKAMLAQGGASIVYDPKSSDVSYGRAIGVVFAGGKNLNYELVRSGAASALWYHSATKAPSIVDDRSLAEMQQQAIAGNRGMWSQPYFKAYHDAGKSITFNTFSQTNKIVAQQGYMDLFLAMNKSQENGAYGPADYLSATAAGREIHIGQDSVMPGQMDWSTSDFNFYGHELNEDVNTWMRTHGSGDHQNKFSRKQGYGDLDMNMALDSTGDTTSIENKRRLEALSTYHTSRMMGQERRMRMSMMQRAALDYINRSPINHYMM